MSEKFNMYASTGDTMSEKYSSAVSQCEKLDSFDYEKLLETRDSIVEQLPYATFGYNKIAEFMNAASAKYCLEPTNEALLEKELGDWLTIDKLEFINATKEFDSGVTFSLIATPNVGITCDDFQKISQYFAFSHGLVRRSNLADYSPSELSGNCFNRKKQINFSLIPNVFTSSIKGTDVSEINRKYFNFKKELDYIGVPSPLQFLANAEIMYEKGCQDFRELISASTVVHFTLPEKNLGTRKKPEPTIPVSYIDGEYLHQIQVPVKNSIYTKYLRVGINS